MSSPADLISKWPLLRQIMERKDGTGLEAMSDKTREMHARTDNAQVARSICPYCGVGCGQLIYHRDGKLVSIEGDPESPISQGNLCPKGAASFQLLTHDRRETAVKYRAPGAARWSSLSLDRAMDMVADRVWETRRRTFVRETGRCDGQSHRGLVSPWRRHARQRRKLPDQETLYRRPGHGVRVEPGPDMT